MKIDDKARILWQRRYGQNFDRNHFRGLIELTGGRLLLLGIGFKPGSMDWGADPKLLEVSARGFFTGCAFQTKTTFIKAQHENEQSFSANFVVKNTTLDRIPAGPGNDSVTAIETDLCAGNSL